MTKKQESAPAMKFSVGLYPNLPVPNLIKLAQRAEDIGFSTAWVPDSHLLWREAYVTMTAIAASTQRIRIGTAVTNPITRRVTVTASAMSTLAEVSNNRAVLGLSVGDSALRTEGLVPATVATLERDISHLRSIMRGEAVEIIPQTPIELAYAQRERAVPIYVAATGPRMLDLAGRLADGVILMNGVAPHLIADAIDRVRSAATRVGRNPDDIKIVVWAACCVSGTDPASAVDAVKYNVARALLRKIPGMESERLAPLIEKLRDSYDYREHGSSGASFGSLVPDDLVSDFAFAGTRHEVAAQVQRLDGLGIDEVAFALPNAPAPIDQPNVLEELSEIVAGLSQPPVVRSNGKDDQ